MPVGSPTYLDFQSLADDNSAAPPLGAPEGNYQGRHVNDTLRHLMAVIRRLGDAALLTTGANAALANISMGGFKITNLADATTRLDAAHLGMVQDGTAHWGGTTTGSGAAYAVTMTPPFTGSFYRTGQQVRCLLHAANTSTTPTLNAGTPGAKTITHRNGAALRVGDLKAARYTFEFDGTNWRVLDAGGFMEQATYDLIYPTGTLIIKRTTEASPATLVPAGVSASWFRHTHEGFLRAKASGVPSFGSGTGYVTDAQGSHAHNFSGTTGNNSAATVVESGGPTSVAANPHTHSFSGTTDAGGVHQHNYVPPFLEVVVWERTA